MSKTASIRPLLMTALLLSGTTALAHSTPGGENEFLEGSGWFTRAGQKTQLALAAECEAGQYQGHFEFSDKALNLHLRDASITSIHADGDDTRVVEGSTRIVGAAPGDTSAGSFRISFTDTSNAVLVELSNGYYASGNLQRGDLRIHRHPGPSGCSQPPPVDTAPPMVAITAPADGDTVSGMVTLAATASDDKSGVAGVQFQLDGVAVGSEDTTAPYSLVLDSSTTSNGKHTLTARARDGAGNIGNSAAVTVTVNNDTTPPPDTTPPTVAFTVPADGATVAGTVTLSATASDDRSGVAGVQFKVDGIAIGSEDTAAPYSIAWDSTTVANGSHVLTALARDGAGNSKAASITVTVNNSSGGGTTVRVEENDPAVVYTSTWVTATDSSLSGGSITESNTASATATVSFTGTGVTWIGYRCACAAGIANLYVDGSFVASTDSYSPSPQAQARIYTVNGLPRGPHTFRIEVTGQYNNAGETAYIVVDAFDINQ